MHARAPLASADRRLRGVHNRVYGSRNIARDGRSPPELYDLAAPSRASGTPSRGPEDGIEKRLSPGRAGKVPRSAPRILRCLETPTGGLFGATAVGPPPQAELRETAVELSDIHLTTRTFSQWRSRAAARRRAAMPVPSPPIQQERRAPSEHPGQPSPTRRFDSDAFIALDELGKTHMRKNFLRKAWLQWRKIACLKLFERERKLVRCLDGAEGLCLGPVSIGCLNSNTQRPLSQIFADTWAKKASKRRILLAWKSVISKENIVPRTVGDSG
ncbi:hypothetical protein BDK51DRAFT_40886 [Blyttiomyces helicus]|uniref:Uncharacterized protein n=1 Tax=Blyttiomyces helicus TaxID=388810 RepID=A0A4P9W486_9FUNG|nr:hypothetical protein BDK51DRAFT_40886 [Blyttiomyces helicus]|eukprot:RKO86093.1 hypothetical protein BDK51DRAFT_40886 [Blyttiomyces helicus]